MSEFLDVAEQVLVLTEKPMSAKRIVEHAITNRMFSERVAGETPHQTMKSKLSVDIRRHGVDSVFVRTAPGRFFLRRLLPSSHPEYRAAEYEKPPSQERILVFPSTWLDQRGRFQGISPSWKGFLRDLVSSGTTSYMSRAAAEVNDDYKQVLTYVFVTRGKTVLCFKRGSYNLAAQFLRGAHCIGFGGHVSDDDLLPLFPSDDLGITDSVLRELREELVLPPRDQERLRRGDGLTCVGLLNDDSSAVGRRHIAFLFRYEVSRDDGWRKPERGEKSITQLRWLRAGESTRVWDFEYWSQLGLQQFFPSVVKRVADHKVVRRTPFRQPHLMCVLGEVGSGKTELTRVLTSTFGYREVNSGRVLAKLLDIPPVPDTARDVFQRKAWEFISSDQGPSLLARALVEEAKQAGCERVLIDGIRQRTTLNALRLLAAPMRLGLIYVHTLPHIAYKFYQLRSSSRVTIEEFLRIRAAPVEQDVSSFIEDSDAVLYNWTGKRRLHSAISSMMDLVGVAPCKAR